MQLNDSITPSIQRVLVHGFSDHGRKSEVAIFGIFNIKYGSYLIFLDFFPRSGTHSNGFQRFFTLGTFTLKSSHEVRVHKACC